MLCVVDFLNVAQECNCIIPFKEKELHHYCELFHHTFRRILFFGPVPTLSSYKHSENLIVLLIARLLSHRLFQIFIVKRVKIIFFNVNEKDLIDVICTSYCAQSKQIVKQ